MHKGSIIIIKDDHPLNHTYILKTVLWSLEKSFHDNNACYLKSNHFDDDNYFKLLNEGDI